LSKSETYRNSNTIVYSIKLFINFILYKQLALLVGTNNYFPKCYYKFSLRDLRLNILYLYKYSIISIQVILWWDGGLFQHLRHESFFVLNLVIELIIISFVYNTVMYYNILHIQYCITIILYYRTKRGYMCLNQIHLSSSI